MNETIQIPEGITEKEFQMFRKNLEDARQLMTYYECAAMEIGTKLNVLSKEFSMSQNYNPIETIKTRIKSVESIMGKLQRNHLPFSIESVEEHIHDIAGIRVICPFINDIYTIGDCLLDQDDVFLIQMKDYISKPKENGYRSLHLIVETPIFLQNEKKMMKVEIQLRTIAMDFWASLEHRMRYKKEIEADDLEAISSELKSCAEASAALDIRMEQVKDSIHQVTKK